MTQKSHPSGTRPHIWFIAPFPPPLNGQSNYNKVLLEMMKAQATVTCIETGKGSKEKIVRAVQNAWIVLTRIPKGATVYTSAPGQMGLWLFLLVIAALRLRGLDHFVHHHSFRGVNLAPMASHRWLTRLGGSLQRHVFLSEAMFAGYAAAYLSPDQKARALVVPNAFLFAQALPPFPTRQGPITIGHLSVMTREKGVDYILALIVRLLPQTDLCFVLGGPIKDDSLRAEVEALVAAHSDRVDWTGPLEGEAKEAFYSRTDLFLLPSKLIDEADPLVLLEAFSAGAVASGSSRGCIPDRVMTPEHLLSMSIDEDAAMLQALAAEIAADRRGYADRAQAHAKKLFEDARAQGKKFFAELGLLA